ncbi:hypothetical protein S40288_11282 [Stachybotrys chartarum IBT 40288]|nr:hypothetical protein S40288_11282 [Stachybotrys chartarum IBT 40288]
MMDPTQLLGIDLQSPSTYDIGGPPGYPFAKKSAISIIDLRNDGIARSDSIDDTGYKSAFKDQEYRERVLCVPWSRNLQMQISPSLFQLICREYDLPVAFQYALLSRDKSLESTKGCFFFKDNSRQSDRFCVFHKLQIEFNATLAICTIYDHADDTIFHLVIGKVAYLQPWSDRENSNPLGENAETPDEGIKVLHNLAQTHHIILENLANIEQALDFLDSAMDQLSKSGYPITAQAIETDRQLLRYIRSACLHSKRWVSNYRDRVNIQINLAFHLSQQQDNRVNAQLAEDSYREASAMTTIAVAIFGMVFFDYASDENGAGSIHTSGYLWWYFLSSALVTGTVFLAWGYWKRTRERQYLERHKAQKKKEPGELTLLVAEYMTEPENPVRGLGNTPNVHSEVPLDS